MIETLRRYPLISALGVLTAVLIVVAGFELAAGAALRERVAAAGPPRPATVQTKLLPQIAAVNPEQEYAETGARPLFIPTRRPAPPAAVAAAPSSMVKGQFILTGVTIVGPLKIALLREKSSGRVVRVEQGKEVNGVTVAQIDPERVTLAQGGDQEIVSLLVTKGGAAPAQGPVAGPFATTPTAAPGGPPGIAAPAPVVDPTVNPAARAAPPPPTSAFGPPLRVPMPPQQPAATANPADAATPGAQAPMTPEELLARRRARRAQQTQ